MIDVDGSYGEGGGQILRTSVALSAVSGVPVRISRIRAGRPNPGIMAQHLTSVEAIARLCDARVEGLKLGSTTIEFVPGPVIGGDLALDVGTAGSTTLILQSCMIAATVAKSNITLTLKGGTDVRWSPPFDYIRMVHLPMAERFGARCDLELVSRGFYPEGGGELRAELWPSPTLKAVTLETPGELQEVVGMVFAQNLPEHVVTRMKHAALKRLVGCEKVKIESDTRTGAATGAGIVLVGECGSTVLGASALGERGVRAETLGERCASDLLETLRSGATVDEHMLDQIIPYMGLAEGSSQVLADEVSGHARTNMWIVEKFTGRSFEVRERGNLFEVCVD